MNKRNLYVALGLIAIFAIIWSCKKNEVEHRTVASVNYYYSYFPLHIGSTYIYQVDSLKYNPGKFQFDTINYLLKEVIDSPFIDNTGQTAYKVFRWTSKDTTKGWTAQRVWVAKLTKAEALRWEENIWYARLYFPVVSGYAWDGNRYNTTDPDKLYNYFYQEVHKPFTVAGHYYDSTVLVSEINYNDPFESHIETERYAAGVGLVSREATDTLFNGNYTSDKSYFYKQHLLNYTK